MLRTKFVIRHLDMGKLRNQKGVILRIREGLHCIRQCESCLSYLEWLSQLIKLIHSFYDCSNCVGSEVSSFIKCW